MRFSRRHFLLAGGLLGGGAYINHRGLRFPRLGFEPPALPAHYHNEELDIKLANMILSGGRLRAQPMQLRAIAPAAGLTIQSKAPQLQFEVLNLSPLATLETNAGHVTETINGCRRNLVIEKVANTTLNLNWRLPEAAGWRVAVIGDSGGGNELAWCIERAEQLGAHFMLHLGDFNYSPGEYQAAIEKFNSAPYPVFVSIGNHDFNDSGLVYQQFREQIGPMNNAFAVGGFRFVNVDTAASRLPAWSGNRGALVDQLQQDQTRYQETVFFTHKPFVDARQGRDHTLSGIGEQQWLYKTMQRFKSDTLLCGHVHRSSINDYHGIRQITAGEGLGFEDIRMQKQVATILMAELNKGENIRYTWEPLNMPWNYHTSPTHIPKMQRQGLQRQLQWYQQKMAMN